MYFDETNIKSINKSRNSQLVFALFE